jgi:hypothetical protein
LGSSIKSTPEDGSPPSTVEGDAEAEEGLSRGDEVGRRETAAVAVEGAEMRLALGRWVER